MKSFKLTPEQIKKYEEMSGFKTTGNVEVILTDDKVWKAYIDIALTAKLQSRHS